MKLQFPGSITKYTYLQNHSSSSVGSLLTPGFKMWFQQTNVTEVTVLYNTEVPWGSSRLGFLPSLPLHFSLFLRGKEFATLYNQSVS